MQPIKAILFLFILAGCGQLQAAREQNYANRCAAMGFPLGSQQLLECRLGLEALDLQRRAGISQALRDTAATLQAAQPSTVPPAPYWTGIGPGAIHTTCRRFGDALDCSTR